MFCEIACDCFVNEKPIYRKTTNKEYVQIRCSLPNAKVGAEKRVAFVSVFITKDPTLAKMIMASDLQVGERIVVVGRLEIEFFRGKTHLKIFANSVIPFSKNMESNEPVTVDDADEIKSLETDEVEMFNAEEMINLN